MPATKAGSSGPAEFANDHPGPGRYDWAFKDAELVVRRLDAGVDGVNRWSFIQRGDFDGPGQFIETWETKSRE